MKEKKILVTQSSMPPYEEYMEEIKSIWESFHLTNMGPKHQDLTAKLQDYLEVDGVSLFTNGHLGLQVALRALQLEGEVITTPFTFVSTTHSIVECGLTPVFCDINREDYTIDVTKIESLITDKTCAIMPVHIYGVPCDVEAIERIAKKHNLKVIYDAAHTFGVKLNGRGIGSYGDASMFSFHATKVFHTVEGGAVTYSDPEFGKRLESIRSFGMTGGDHVDYIGTNAKMSEYHAAMGLCNLRHIDTYIEKRKTIYEEYIKYLGNVEGLEVIRYKDNIQPNYAYFPVVFNEDVFGKTRDEVCEELQKHNIFSRKYFYPLTNRMECYQGRFDLGETPVADYVSDRVLTLPMYSELQLEDVEKICKVILGEK